MIQGHVLTSLVFSELGFGFKSHSPERRFSGLGSYLAPVNPKISTILYR